MFDPVFCACCVFPPPRPPKRLPAGLFCGVELVFPNSPPEVPVVPGVDEFCVLAPPLSEEKSLLACCQKLVQLVQLVQLDPPCEARRIAGLGQCSRGDDPHRQDKERDGQS